MADALSITVLSMSNDMQRLSTLSHNLANATTPAFRREIAYSRPFVEHLGSAALQVTLPQFRSSIDQRPGTLRHTGAPLDVALEGAGWFELQSEDGVVYTRRGDFQLDARGRLVSHGGLPVMGSSGEITLGGGAVRIDNQGRVFEDQRAAGQLRVLNFDNPRALVPAGAGLFRAPETAASPVETPRLRQGYVENANLQTVAEMVRLIETMRHFETSQKLVQGVDDMLGRAIRTLGEY